MVDNLITLHNTIATDMNTLGLGVLKDAIKCEVLEEINGQYILNMEYPINGIHYEEIQLNCIIQSRSNMYGRKQMFRINNISRPLNGIVDIEAQHISYDLSGIMAAPFFASTSVEAIDRINSSDDMGEFKIVNLEYIHEGQFDVTKPCSVRSLLGGQELSLVHEFGGELEFDNKTVYLKTYRGGNNGVQIKYGKNLTELNLDESFDGAYSHVYPFWYKKIADEGVNEDYGVSEFVEVIGRYIEIHSGYPFKRCVPLDFSGIIKEKPTPTELKAEASKYIKAHAHEMGIPKVSLTVSFELLSQFKEYENITLLEKVSLGDIVSVEYDKLKVNATARCTSTLYDAINNKYISLELGDAKQKISDTIYDNGHKTETDWTDKINQAMNGVPTMGAIEEAIASATGHINGGLGGYVILRDSRGGLKPDELLVMNTENVNTARNVWRFNKNGLAFSSNGYNGPYKVAMTSDGKINAEMITTGVMVASGTFTGTIHANSGNIGNYVINNEAVFSTDGVTGMSTMSGAAFWAGCSSLNNISGSNFLVEKNGNVRGAYANFKNFYVDNHPIIERGKQNGMDYIIFYEGTKIVYFDIDVDPIPETMMCVPFAFPDKLKFTYKPAIVCSPITSNPYTSVRACACRDRTAYGANLYFMRKTNVRTTVSILAVGKWDR